MGIVQDTSRDDAVRLQAANVLLPYVKPRLASVEQRNIDDAATLSEAEIMAKLKGTISASPDLLVKVVTVACESVPGLAQRVVDACGHYLQLSKTQPESSAVQPQAALH